MNNNKIILDLCGGSGSWSRFYKINGYDVRLITLPDFDVRSYIPPENVYGVLAAPPCTEFSILNPTACNRFRNFNSGLEIVNACLRIIKECNPKFYAIENPVGFLRKYMGKPLLTFQPWFYGDPWTKRTDIYGSFNLPEQLYFNWEDVPKLDLPIRKGRQKPSLAFMHKSCIDKIPQFSFTNPENDAAFRAITPPGFAYQFYLANQ